MSGIIAVQIDARGSRFRLRSLNFAASFLESLVDDVVFDRRAGSRFRRFRFGDRRFDQLFRQFVLLFFLRFFFRLLFLLRLFPEPKQRSYIKNAVQGADALKRGAVSENGARRRLERRADRFDGGADFALLFDKRIRSSNDSGYSIVVVPKTFAVAPRGRNLGDRSDFAKRVAGRANFSQQLVVLRDDLLNTLDVRRR